MGSHTLLSSHFWWKIALGFTFHSSGGTQVGLVALTPFGMAHSLTILSMMVGSLLVGDHLAWRHRWYISNVSIIFDCSMLLYYLFWMLMGFILHFYIILGTNLLTGGPTQNCCFFCLFQCFVEKEYQTEWNLRESYFWNKRNPGDLEWTSRKKREATR